MRKLTKRFLMSVLDKHEKATKEGVNDLMAKVSTMSIQSMIDVIVLGNNNIDREEAANILDNYLADEDNTLATAMLDLIEELEKDTKILKMAGVNIKDFRKSIEEELKEQSKDIMKNIVNKDKAVD